MDSQTQPPTVDMAAIYARMEEMHNDRRTEVAGQRAALFTILVNAGIDRVEANYDAYGDSGNVENVDLFCKTPPAPPPEGPDCAQAESPAPYQVVKGAIADDVMTRLQDFFWSSVYVLHPGFENNDGGYGEIAWDIGRNAISIEHNERFVDVSCYSYEDL